jgi:hypothetical protein
MTYDLITRHDSRNFTPAAQVQAVFGRRRTIESITIHWWGLPEWNATFEGTTTFLCTNTKPTSAHEVIEAGRVAVIVAHGDAAWAAGNARGNATSIHLECNPRASDADYATVAERIRDIRAMHGNLPLIPHRDWQATMCPGVWDLARLDALARAAVTTQGTTTSEEDDMTPEQAAQLAYIASPDFKAHIFAGTAEIEKAARAQFSRDLLNTDVPWFGFDGSIPASGRTTTTPATDIGWADSRAAGAVNQTAALAEDVAELKELVIKLIQAVGE